MGVSTPQPSSRHDRTLAGVQHDFRATNSFISNVPLLMRSWILRACHTTMPCHQGATGTFFMLERLYWWVGMDSSVLWWLRHCHECQARKTSRLTIRWPTLSLPLPNGLDMVVSVDYFEPLLVTPRGNSYVFIFTDRFSHRADVFSPFRPHNTCGRRPTYLSICASRCGAVQQQFCQATNVSFVPSSLTTCAASSVSEK